jgi:UDP-N-acetylmuramate dehydrogenase
MSASTAPHRDSPSVALPFWKRGESFARHTTMRVGGPIGIWAEPQSEDELAHTLREVARRGLPLQVLGAGSNVVAPQSGFDGVVLHLGRGFDWERAEGKYLDAGGASLLPKLSKAALANGLGNFEWCCGVPGSLGGSIWGNAGARGWNGEAFESRDCAADLHSLIAFDRAGRRVELKRADIEFSYRKSSLGELIVAQARFELKPLSPTQVEEHRRAVSELLALRRNSQPVNVPSAGCIWKNPGAEACAHVGCRGTGELLEKLGLKGLRVGGAQISPIHGNFLVNDEGGSADDVRALAALVEAQVLERTGVALEREVRFWEF